MEQTGNKIAKCIGKKAFRRYHDLFTRSFASFCHCCANVTLYSGLYSLTFGGRKGIARDQTWVHRRGIYAQHRCMHKKTFQPYRSSTNPTNAIILTSIRPLLFIYSTSTTSYLYKISQQSSHSILTTTSPTTIPTTQQWSPNPPPSKNPSSTPRSSRPSPKTTSS